MRNNPGDFNKKVKILKFSEVSDGAGGYLDNWLTEEGWSAVATVWASVKPLRGREFYQAQQAQSEVTHKVVIRYRNDVKPSQIMIYNGRRLNVQYVINIDEKNTYLELMCVESL